MRIASVGGRRTVSVVNSAMPSVADKPGSSPITMPTSVAPSA
jgi:hypothetical protein